MSQSDLRFESTPLRSSFSRPLSLAIFLFLSFTNILSLSPDVHCPYSDPRNVYEIVINRNPHCQRSRTYGSSKYTRKVSVLKYRYFRYDFQSFFSSFFLFSRIIKIARSNCFFVDNSRTFNKSFTRAFVQIQRLVTEAIKNSTNFMVRIEGFKKRATDHARMILDDAVIGRGHIVERLKCRSFAFLDVKRGNTEKIVTVDGSYDILIASNVWKRPVPFAFLKKIWPPFLSRERKR